MSSSATGDGTTPAQPMPLYNNPVYNQHVSGSHPFSKVLVLRRATSWDSGSIVRVRFLEGSEYIQAKVVLSPCRRRYIFEG
jgi:hypothetical protein